MVVEVLEVVEMLGVFETASLAISRGLASWNYHGKSLAASSSMICTGLVLSGADPTSLIFVSHSQGLSQTFDVDKFELVGVSTGLVSGLVSNSEQSADIWWN